MAIQLSHDINLADPAIQAFITDRLQQEYLEQSAPPSGFSASGESPKLSGQIDSDPAGRTLLLPSCIVETYNVIEGGTHGSTGVTVGSFDAIIPVEQAVRLTFFADLFISFGISESERSAIIAAFKAYDPAALQDPDDYMAAILRDNEALQPSMFKTNLFTRISKIGDPVEHTQERDRKLEPYSGMSQGSVWDGSGEEHPVYGDAGYFVERRLTAKLVSSRSVLEIPSEPPSPFRIEAPADQFDKALEHAVEHQAEATSCSGDGFHLQRWKIASLMTFPEFKVVWRTADIEIGCGVHITLSYPVLQIRWSDLTLFAFARYPANLGHLIENAIKECAWRAALAGAVIGVAMGNFASAVAAFRALFTECLKAKFNEAITCMLPGLALDVEIAQDWRDI